MPTNKQQPGSRVITYVVIGLSVILVALLALTILLPSDGDGASKKNSAFTGGPTPTAFVLLGTPINRLRALVRDEFAGTTNTGRRRLKQTEVFEGETGGYVVELAFNADAVFGSGLAAVRKGIESRMRDGYEAIYTSEEDVRRALITAHFPLPNDFGEIFDKPVYTTVMDRDLASTLDWANKLRVDLGPLWEVRLLLPEFVPEYVGP
jgi:hypothetical protein